MLARTRSFAQRPEHHWADSCVFVVLTHGEYYERLIGVDGERVLLHDLLDCFSIERAPALAAKPKIFFVQACRGGKCSRKQKVSEFC